MTDNSIKESNIRLILIICVLFSMIVPFGCLPGVNSNNTININNTKYEQNDNYEDDSFEQYGFSPKSKTHIIGKKKGEMINGLMMGLYESYDDLMESQVAERLKYSKTLKRYFLANHGFDVKHLVGNIYLQQSEACSSCDTYYSFIKKIDSSKFATRGFPKKMLENAAKKNDIKFSIKIENIPLYGNSETVILDGDSDRMDIMFYQIANKMKNIDKGWASHSFIKH